MKNSCRVSCYQALTVLCRSQPRVNHSLANATKVLNFDTLIFALLGQFGKAGYLEIPDLFYRVHSGGLWSTISCQKTKLKFRVELYKEINKCISPPYKEIARNKIIQAYHQKAQVESQDKLRGFLTALLEYLYYSFKFSAPTGTTIRRTYRLIKVFLSKSFLSELPKKVSR